jgi:photosystem II stability/assembly factor-like uncharacterized protein
MNRTSLYISVAIIICCFNNNILSQGSWEKVDSPTSQNLNSVHFVDSLYGWAVGDSGTIIHTTNGGSNWDLQNSNTLNEIADVFFLNRNLGWAPSWNVSVWPFGTLVLKTTNGGQIWTSEPYTDDLIFIRCIIYLDSLNGWMGGTPHALVRTSDGGEHWEQAEIDTSLLAFLPVSNIHFYNSQYGYVCGGAFEFAGVIWKTTNGGNKWFAIDITFAPPDPIHEIHIFDSLNVIGIGGDRESQFGIGTFRTKDGGMFWEYKEHGIPGFGSDLAFRTDYEGWAPITSAQSLVFSLDSGLTWTEIPASDSSSILDLFFPDSLHGSFTAAVNDEFVSLKWSTATETNNQGFEVERQVGNSQSSIGNWEKIAFVAGHGTTTEVQSYSFTDSKIEADSYKYRLKQIDFNGTFDYSKELSVKVTKSLEYVLEQNYPNPFNPVTTIKYSIAPPSAGGGLPEGEAYEGTSFMKFLVTLTVYDILGNEIVTLVNEEKIAGIYEVEFSAGNTGGGLPSGVYLYQLRAVDPSSSSAQGFVETRKMILLR